jgi:hypothetical protein
MTSPGQREVVPGRTDVGPAARGHFSRARNGVLVSRDDVPLPQHAISAALNVVLGQRDDILVSRDDVSGWENEVLPTQGLSP